MTELQHYSFLFLVMSYIFFVKYGPVPELCDTIREKSEWNLRLVISFLRYFFLKKTHNEEEHFRENTSYFLKCVCKYRNTMKVQNNRFQKHFSSLLGMVHCEINKPDSISGTGL